MSKQLSINPAMDKLARDNGLGHWSCTDPINAKSWLRSDGVAKWIDISAPTKIDYEFTLVASLIEFDKCFFIGKDWQPSTDLPKQPTLVQKPFEYPCDGALYFTKGNKTQVFISNSGDDYIVGSGGNVHGAWIRENGELAVKDSIQNDSFDLIMFVWE